MFEWGGVCCNHCAVQEGSDCLRVFGVAVLAVDSDLMCGEDRALTWGRGGVGRGGGVFARAPAYGLVMCCVRAHISVLTEAA